MNEVVSVIIPIYKVEKYLPRCVDSIINQTYQNLEIILVDDGSPDNCGKMCDEYAKKDERIKVIHKQNGGLSDARNVGIEEATGKYIAFVDSDDFVTKDYIEYMYDMIAKYDSNLAISGVQVVWKSDEIIEKPGTKIIKLSSEDTFKNLLFGQGIDVCAYAKLYRMELFKDIKFPKGKVYEDTAIMYKIIEKAEKIVYGDKKNYYYIARAGSISKQTGFNKNEEDYIKHTSEMLNYIESNYPKLTTAVHRFDIYAKFRILRMLMVTKPRNKQMEKEYILGIKKYQKDVLKCQETPKRDKMAIILLNLGLPIFKITWTIYCKFTNRI